MATLVLGAVGTAIGGAFGGAILGFSGAAIGGFIGSTVGSVVDSWIVSSLAPAQRIEGARLDTLRITSATEGAVIPRLYGRMRIGGNIIWATDFREETKTTTQGGGKGGGSSKVKTTEYLYYASFAVALCEGPITGIGRIWADGKAMDMTGVTWRWYPGNETQTADPFIAAKMGAANTPAYRGTAYVVFEDLALATFGNRLPQLSFEVFRPLADADTAEGLTRAVTLIPASGEFTYATDAIRKGSGGATVAENLNALPDQPDIVVALDRLQAMAPAVESVSLVVAWFGNDLRAGSCKVKPGVEVASKATTPANWSVNGVSRASAHLVSSDAEERPVYGGTPADFAVVQAIQEMKARGLRVTFYPFLLMDVPPGNTLPNPYSANASTLGQPAFPWRGRITCSPAAGFAGSVDKTGTAATQVSALFGAATPGNFSVSGETVSFTGSPSDWGLRRMVLHYAHLCAAAGGVDAFLIGTEMPGLTTIRSGASTYPAVTAFKTLAADVRSILGAGTKIGYAADWSEYFGHHPQDGSGDVHYHLDPLWSDTNIDFVGIDNYLPLSDWRDGFDHADAFEGWPAIYDRAYLQANIAGGEGFDWFYASAADRSAQNRTAITDGAVGKPWVFRPKDIRAWWTNLHYNRPGGVESGASTAWIPQSKPIRFTELGWSGRGRAAHRSGGHPPVTASSPPSALCGRRASGWTASPASFAAARACRSASVNSSTRRPPMPAKTELPARLVGPGPGAVGAAKWVVTDTGIRMVEDLTARGVTLTSIAKVLGMDTATLRLVRQRQPEVEEAYQRGLAREEEALVGNLRKSANEGNVLAGIFLLRSRHGYQEKRAVDVNVNMGGVLVVPERESVQEYIERKRREGELEGPGEMIDVTPARHDDAHPTKTRLAPAKVTRGD